MKIGILGGTFDPIHIGHLAIAEAAHKSFGLDKVFLMPAGLPYLKSGRNVTPAEDRAEMTKLAAMSYPAFEFCDIEIYRPGNTYTSETLTELHRIYPDDEFFFIVGADTLFQLASWKEPETVFGLASIIAASRNGSTSSELEKCIEKLSAGFNARIFLLDTPEIAVSSSEIRASIKAGKIPYGLVPDSVLDYILKKGLYI